METLQTAYAGLTLRNPLIVASSGLTNNIDKINIFFKKNLDFSFKKHYYSIIFIKEVVNEE